MKTHRAPAVARRRALLAAVLPVALLPACVNFGGDSPAYLSYQLQDLGRATPVDGASIDRTLLVAWSSGSAFYDTTSMAYSRRPGALAYYQFASWSDPPAERLGRLLARRLAQARAFRDVATRTASVNGDWLLEVQLDEMLHDDSSPPGVARIGGALRLVDRAARRTIAARRFVHDEPLAVESAAGAAKAFDRAATRLLDEAVAWVLVQATGA